MATKTANNFFGTRIGRTLPMSPTFLDWISFLEFRGIPEFNTSFTQFLRYIGMESTRNFVRDYSAGAGVD
jgi:hypothetical protein